jgi:hypothetical protein
MVFWLVGEIQPIIKNAFKNIKNIGKKSRLYKRSMFIHQSFVEKRYFYGMCKKYKKMSRKVQVALKVVFFT